MLLEEYTDLRLFDPDDEKTYVGWKLRVSQRGQKSGTTKGWQLVCIEQDGEEEGWFLNEEVIKFIGSHVQESVLQIFKKKMRLIKMQTREVGQINWVVNRVGL